MTSTHRHRASLDGLRFVAFMGVFLHHAFIGHPWTPWLPFVRFGNLGVEVFFVLSGFLIGDILLRVREIDSPLSRRLGAFYARRALRIFPIYYVVVVVVALVHDRLRMPMPADAWIWHLLYLTNVKLFVMGRWIGVGSHFWSLSVEEHFYLLAPLVILCAPRKWLPPLCVATWVAVAAARGIVFHTQATGWYWALSPMHFDALSMGIAAAIVNRDDTFLGVSRQQFVRWGMAAGIGFLLLVAMFHVPLPAMTTDWIISLAAATTVFFWRGGPTSPTIRVRLGRAALLAGVGLSLFIAQQTFLRPDPLGVFPIFFDWLLAAATGALVLMLWRGEGGVLPSILSLPPVVYLGRISYGLYLVHPFVLHVFTKVANQSMTTAAISSFAVSVSIASISWFFFERPIARFKRRFAYGSLIIGSAIGY